MLPTVFLLLAGEGGARAYYFFRYERGFRYPVTPIEKSREEMRSRAVYPYEPRQTYYQLDPCSNRKMTLTVNKERMRGTEWEITRPLGTLRIIAVGGSSTFGVNNPDNATWPAALERILSNSSGMPIEVFNAGLPGYSLKDFNRFLLTRLHRYQPNLVIYYEGWNDTDLPVASQVDRNIRHFNLYPPMGPLSGWLCRRSILYKHLLEKTQFTLVSRKKGAVPDLKRFRGQLEEFVQLVRKHAATPVLVLQVLDHTGGPSLEEFEQTLQHIDLNDRKTMEALILKAAQRDQRPAADFLTKLRVYQTQVLLEVVRKVGAASGVQVIDPRQVFLQYGASEPLFCDVVHLTDLGNQLLAQTIAEYLDFPFERSRSSA